MRFRSPTPTPLLPCAVRNLKRDYGALVKLQLASVANCLDDQAFPAF